MLKYNYKVLILPLLLISILLVSGCVTEGVLKAKFSNLPEWTAGQNGVFPLTVEGGTPPYICAITQGELPQDFVLADCEIDGTPQLLAGGTTQSLSPNFTVTIIDSENPPNIVSVEMAIVVKQPSLTLVTNPVICTVGQQCSANLIANVTGGTPPYHYQSDTFRNGTPPWGTVIGVDGLLIGIPTREGAYTFGVCAVDGVALSVCEQVTAITEPEGAIVLQTGTATCAIGEECSESLIVDVTGGTPPYHFQLGTGTLPEGTNLGTDGTLTGVPTTEGTYTFEVCAVDSAELSKCKQATAIIGPAENWLTLLTGTATCTVDEYCSESLILDVAGGTSPYQFQLGTGTLPEGTAIDIDGTLEGIPTSEGTYTFELCAVDSAASSVCEQATAIIGPAEEEEIYSGQLSGSGRWSKAHPEHGTTCIFYDTYSATISMVLIEGADGSVSGTATVAGTDTSTAISGSVPYFTCTDSIISLYDTATIYGTKSDIGFTTHYYTTAGSDTRDDFTGSLSGNTITGTIIETSTCCPESVSLPVTLTKE